MCFASPSPLSLCAGFGKLSSMPAGGAVAAPVSAGQAVAVVEKAPAGLCTHWNYNCCWVNGITRNAHNYVLCFANYKHIYKS